MSQPLCPVHHTARPESWALTSSRILGAGIGSLGHSWPEAIRRQQNRSRVGAIAPACLKANLLSVRAMSPGDLSRACRAFDATADGMSVYGLEPFDTRPVAIIRHRCTVLKELPTWQRRGAVRRAGGGPGSRTPAGGGSLARKS